MGNVEIINFYLERCERYSSPGGYTLLSSKFGDIKEETLKHFSGNHTKRTVDICDKVIQEHLKTLSSKIRIFDWSFCESDLLREKINISLRGF